MKYKLECIEWNTDTECKLKWEVISIHKYYIGALWAYLNKGGTCRIINIAKGG